jgi:hypothetical protein
MTCLSSWSLCCLRWGEAKAAAWCLFDLFLERAVSIWNLFKQRTRCENEQIGRQITALQHHAVVCVVLSMSLMSGTCSVASGEVMK